MSPLTIQFEVLTPERVVLKEPVLHATIPTKEGEITVLPKHIPLITILKPGVIEVKKTDGTREVIAVSGGFADVLDSKIVILADTAEYAHEIDLERAEAAHIHAQKVKEEAVHRDDVDFTDLSARLEKEFARTSAVRRWRKLRGM